MTSWRAVGVGVFVCSTPRARAASSFSLASLLLPKLPNALLKNPIPSSFSSFSTTCNSPDPISPLASSHPFSNFNRSALGPNLFSVFLLLLCSLSISHVYLRSASLLSLCSESSSQAKVTMGMGVGRRRAACTDCIRFTDGWMLWGVEKGERK